MDKKLFSKLTSCIVSACLFTTFSASASAASESEIRLGDVTGDNIVNSIDASRVLIEYSMTSANYPPSFSDAQRTAADVNKDKMIDARDASHILGYYAYCSAFGNISLDDYISSFTGSGQTSVTTTENVTATTSVSSTALTTTTVQTSSTVQTTTVESRYSLEDIKDSLNAYDCFSRQLSHELFRDALIPDGGGVRYGIDEGITLLTVLNYDQITDGNISNKTVNHALGFTNDERFRKSSQLIYEIAAAEQMTGEKVDFTKYTLNKEIGEYINSLSEAAKNGTLHEKIRLDWDEGKMPESCRSHPAAVGALAAYDIFYYGGETINKKTADEFILNETVNDLLYIIYGIKNVTSTAPVTTAVSTFTVAAPPLDSSELPTYTESLYTVLNNNVPYFSPDDFNGESFEYYSELDELGRCGVCMACIGEDIMPTEERGDIGSVKPTGWHSQTYDIVQGKYLYNRCHLIGFQLTGENANRKNLVTGTRSMNADAMLPFENQTASYVETTHNHVLYRVTPVFESTELVCRGVLMEAWSVADSGAGVCFNVFCYNVQPGIAIDYASGESSLIGDYVTTTAVTSITTAFSSTSTVTSTRSKTTTSAVSKTTASKTTEPKTTSTSVTTSYIGDYNYIVNKKTGVFHNPDCSSVKQMNDENKLYFHGSRDDALSKNYKPCSKCNP